MQINVKELFSEDRWLELASELRGEATRLYQLPAQPALFATIQLGLSTLKTPYLLL